MGNIVMEFGVTRHARSASIFGYTVLMFELFGFSFPILYIHLGTLAALLLLVLFADHQAFSWMTGRNETLDKKTLTAVHYLTYAGLVVMIATGITQAWPLREYLVIVPAFYIKMFFVLALLINSFFIGKLMYIAIERPFKSLSFKEKIPLFITGVVSTGSWVGAIVSAILMGFGNITSFLNL